MSRGLVRVRNFVAGLARSVADDRAIGDADGLSLPIGVGLAESEPECLSGHAHTVPVAFGQSGTGTIAFGGIGPGHLQRDPVPQSDLVGSQGERPR